MIIDCCIDIPGQFTTSMAVEHLLRALADARANSNAAEEVFQVECEGPIRAENIGRAHPRCPPGGTPVSVAIARAAINSLQRGALTVERHGPI
jgi:hypothetical protein